jgi:hypothetical protein
LATTEKLLRVLGLSKLPHFTTIEKFLLRVPGALLERVLGGFILLTRIRKQVFAPDSSGFPPHRASHYYAVRIERDILSSMKKQVEQKEREREVESSTNEDQDQTLHQAHHRCRAEDADRRVDQGEEEGAGKRRQP